MPAGSTGQSSRPWLPAASDRRCHRYQEQITMHEESFFGDSKNWVLIAFFLFFILFGKKLWGALAAILDARTVSVRAELEEAARLRREAANMLRDAEKQRSDALAEAKTLIEGARA